MTHKNGSNQHYYLSIPFISFQLVGWLVCWLALCLPQSEWCNRTKDRETTKQYCVHRLVKNITEQTLKIYVYNIKHWFKLLPYFFHFSLWFATWAFRVGMHIVQYGRIYSYPKSSFSFLGKYFSFAETYDVKTDWLLDCEY